MKVLTPILETAEVRGHSHPPHSWSEWGLEPETVRPRARTRPPRSPASAARGSGPAPPRGAVAQRRSGRRPATRVNAGKGRRLGRRWGLSSLRFPEEKMPPPPAAWGDAAVRVSFSLGPRPPAYSPLAHTPRPRGTGLLPNWRPRKHPRRGPRLHSPRTRRRTSSGLASLRFGASICPPR